MINFGSFKTVTLINVINFKPLYVFQGSLRKKLVKKMRCLYLQLTFANENQ